MPARILVPVIVLVAAVFSLPLRANRVVVTTKRNARRTGNQELQQTTSIATDSSDESSDRSSEESDHSTSDASSEPLATYRSGADIRTYLEKLKTVPGWDVQFVADPDSNSGFTEKIGVAHFRNPADAVRVRHQASSTTSSSQGGGNAAGGGPKRVFFMFGLHARELVSSETGVAFIDSLKKAPLPGFEFMIVLNANPTQREVVLGGTDLCARANAQGVDLNRNWGGADNIRVSRKKFGIGRVRFLLQEYRSRSSGGRRSGGPGTREGRMRTGRGKGGGGVVACVIFLRRMRSSENAFFIECGGDGIFRARRGMRTVPGERRLISPKRGYCGDWWTSLIQVGVMPP